VATIGPVVVQIYVSQNFIQYVSGVLSDSLCVPSNLPNHDVLVIGYGTLNGHDYWLIKNSSGQDWGLSGYAMLALTIRT
jgi:C1A family cysteine protease